MAAGGARGELHIGLALLEHADHCKVSLYAADGLGDYAAALVADYKQLHAAALELLDDLRRAVARPLLGAGGGKVHVAFGSIALAQQLFYRLKESHDRALGIGCAAPPDLAVGNVPGERLVQPLALSRDNVLMAHKEDGLFAALALPII